MSGSNRDPEIQIMEALALPEGDPVYEVSIRGWGWQREVQQIRASGVPAPNETEIQVGVQSISQESSCGAEGRVKEILLGLNFSVLSP